MQRQTKNHTRRTASGKHNCRRRLDFYFQRQSLSQNIGCNYYPTTHKNLPDTYKSIKNHDSSYPIVAIIESENKIGISYKSTVVRMPLSDIESLRIQSIKGNVKSLLLTTKSFNNLRFEGYENLAEMAELLKKIYPGRQNQKCHVVSPLTNDSNRSLRSLGRAKARPLTKR